MTKSLKRARARAARRMEKQKPAKTPPVASVVAVPKDHIPVIVHDQKADSFNVLIVKPKAVRGFWSRLFWD